MPRRSRRDTEADIDTSGDVTLVLPESRLFHDQSAHSGADECIKTVSEDCQHDEQQTESQNLQDHMALQSIDKLGKECVKEKRGLRIEQLDAKPLHEQLSLTLRRSIIALRMVALGQNGSYSQIQKIDGAGILHDAVKARAEAMSRADRPNAAAAAWVKLPSSIPRTDARPALRPCAALLVTIYIPESPAAQMQQPQTSPASYRKASRSTS